MAVTKYLDKTGLTYFWSKLKTWANSLFVHLSGNETISGYKTFTNYIVSKRTDPAFEGILEGYTKGDDLSSQKQAGLFVHDQTGNFNGDTRLGAFYVLVSTDKSIVTGISAYNNISGSIGLHYLRVTSNPDGTGYASCPTPAVSDDSNKIATTEWVRDATGNTALNAATASKIEATPASGGTYVGGAKVGGALVNVTNTGYGAIWNAPTKDYRVACATHPSNTNNVYLCYSISNDNISSNTNTISKSLIWNADTGILTANTFSGSLSGNATTVTGTAGTSTLAWNSEVTLYTVGGNAIKAKLPANPNTDTKVRQVAGTSSTERPLLSRYNTADTSNTDNYTIYDTNVTVNPNTHIVTASGGFSGNKFTAKSTVIDRANTITDSNSEYWPITYKDKNDLDLSGIGLFRHYKTGIEQFVFRLRNTNNDWADLRFTFNDDGTYYLGFSGKNGTVCDGFHGNLVGIIKDTIALDTISTIPSSDVFSTIYETRSNDGKIVADMYIGRSTLSSGYTSTVLRSRCSDGVSTNHAYFHLWCNSDGTSKYATTSAIFATTDNSDKVPTTAWIRTATGNTALNAATATKLATARTINGVSFDGSANITVADSTKLPLAGGTVTGTLILSRSTDASGTADNTPALIVGGASTATHIEMDGNEILCKSNGTTPTTLNLNTDGGLVSVGTGGIKTTGTIITTSSFVKNHPSITKGTNPSATQYWTLTFGDKDGSNYSNNCLGMLETSITSAGVVSTYIRAMKNTAANSSNCQISCIYDTANNTAYTSAPTPATSDNSTKIATTAFVKAQNYITSSSNITGTAANVTGTVAIANGGTGATTRLNAIKALTNENVGTNATHFLGLKSDWSKVGYVSVGDAKTVLGLGSAAYTASTDYVAKSGDTMSGVLAISKSGSAMFHSTSTGNSTAANNWDCWIGIGGSGKGGLYDNTRGYYFVERAPTTGIVTIVAKKDDKSATGTFTFGNDGKLNATSFTAASAKTVSNNGLYDITNTSSTFVCGGSSITTSSHIKINGYQASSFSFMLRALSPTSTSTYADLVLDYGGTLKWKGQTVQTSSDERLKTPISSVDDNVLDAWADVSWGQFKFLDSVKEKGDNARFHVGLIAQGVDRICSTRNVDIRKYGILCHDEWEDEYIEENGKQVLYNKAGDIWMVRYTEALCMEAAYQRRKNKILENRISELENQLSFVLQTLKELKGVG